jgi:lipoate-protein ligase B
MYYNPFHYPAIPPIQVFPAYTLNAPFPRIYPPVDIHIFEMSVKTFRQLMEQGSILLARLGDGQFARKVMSAAQQGNHLEVDQLIKSIGLRVPVKSAFTPTGVNFTLATHPDQLQSINCCTLTIAMKWGR